MILLRNQKGNVIDIDSPGASSESDINSDYSEEFKENTKLNNGRQRNTTTIGNKHLKMVNNKKEL